MSRQSFLSDKMQTALDEVRNVYVDLAQRPIERNCVRRTECCHFKLTGTHSVSDERRSVPRS